MTFRWELLAAAFLTTSILLAFQKRYLIRMTDRIIETESESHDVALDHMRRTRQDVAGVMILLTITNALLAGILGVLLIR